LKLPATVKITNDQQRQGRQPAREQIHPCQQTGRLALEKVQQHQKPGCEEERPGEGNLAESRAHPWMPNVVNYPGPVNYPGLWP
jgi:hypothetical protein